MVSSAVDKPYPNADLENLWQQLLLLILVIVAIFSLVWLGNRYREMQDPYVQSVMAIPGDADRGEAIFMNNCAGCHRADASGLVGPKLWGVSERKSQFALIQQVVSGDTPPMPQFQPSPQEMADLLQYLNHL
ncbi:cytochrome c [Prochlorothrix hollandica]|uniref:cytochrome c n=1 Tax=Prochlorothrix hollandica TaxID=1223 RepID=UPI003342422D